MATSTTTFITPKTLTNIRPSTLTLTNQKVKLKQQQQQQRVVVAMGARYEGTRVREMKLGEMIESKVTEAKEVCEGDEGSDECKVAWDEVEEVSQAKAHLRMKLERDEDPMEDYCVGNPERDECRVSDR